MRGIAKIAAAGAIALSALAGGAASAATLTFGPGGWDYNEGGSVPWVATFDDDTVGFWTVTLSIAAASGTDIGSFKGFGFDTTLTGLSDGDFGFVSSNTGEGIVDVGFNTRSCGSGCNFNGATNANFDAVVELGEPGAGDGLLTNFVFTIATTEALALGSITRVGVRGQTIGAFPNGGNDSSKDLNETGVFTPDAAVVPLPAAGWLLLAGVGGLVALRRKGA